MLEWVCNETWGGLVGEGDGWVVVDEDGREGNSGILCRARCDGVLGDASLNGV